MGNRQDLSATVIMKREDGISILDAVKPIRADTADDFNVTEERAAEIQQRLEKLGFQIITGNLNTLSISGSQDNFVSIFNLEISSGENQAEISSGDIPETLADLIADIYITPPPVLFP